MKYLDVLALYVCIICVNILYIWMCNMSGRGNFWTNLEQNGAILSFWGRFLPLFRSLRSIEEYLQR